MGMWAEGIVLLLLGYPSSCVRSLSNKDEQRTCPIWGCQTGRSGRLVGRFIISMVWSFTGFSGLKGSLKFIMVGFLGCLRIISLGSCGLSFGLLKVARGRPIRFCKAFFWDGTCHLEVFCVIKFLNVIKLKLCRIMVALSFRGLVWDALCRVLGGGPWARLLRFILFCLRVSKSSMPFCHMESVKGGVSFCVRSF